MPSSEGPFTDITHPEMLPASSGLAQASLDFYEARATGKRLSII